MQNFVQTGDVINYTVSGSAVAAGDVVVIGRLVGVAVSGGAVGAMIAVKLCGVFALAKNTGFTIAQGDKLYWNTSSKYITKTATDVPLGTAFAAAASGDTLAVVSLYENGSQFPTAANVAAITTANGSDLATTQALANATKTTVNAIITALQGAGLMA